MANKFIALCLFSFTAEYLMNSFLGVVGTFWVYASLNFLGFIFCLVFVKETMGLTDVQKKLLYAPRVSEDSEPETKAVEEENEPNSIN